MRLRRLNARLLALKGRQQHWQQCSSGALRHVVLLFAKIKTRIRLHHPRVTHHSFQSKRRIPKEWAKTPTAAGLHSKLSALCCYNNDCGTHMHNCRQRLQHIARRMPVPQSSKTTTTRILLAPHERLSRRWAQQQELQRMGSDCHCWCCWRC